MSQISPQPSRQPVDAHIPTLRRLRRLSYVLDSAVRIPGTRYRVGLDPLLGLLPGAGDFLGTALSAYIVLEAARLGLPRAALGQMVSNILLETVVGTVPVLGDLVDVAWKANTKNLMLLEEYFNVPRQRQKTDWLFLSLLLGGLLIVVTVVAAISIMLLRWLIGLVSG